MLLIPLHHPLRVAEECIAIDLLSGGRLELGLGIGFRQEELDAFGVPRTARRSTLEDGIEVLRGAWSGEPFTVHGQHVDVDRLTVTPRPVQPDLPLWLAARDEAPARRAGRVGADLHLLGGRSILTAYDEELAAHATPARRTSVSVFKPFFVAEDPAAELGRYRDQFEYFTARHAGWVGANRDVAFDADLRSPGATSRTRCLA